MFNPQRLTLARMRRRLTGKALAELTGFTAVTISRLERSNNDPEPETIDALAAALGFPKEFFAGDNLDTPSEDGASFRSLTAMTAKERDAALSAGAFAYLLCDWVSERFNLPITDLPDLGEEKDPEKAARILRDRWALGEQPITNMVKLLESKGVRVFSLSENTKAVDAFSCWRNATPYVFLNTFKSPERSRFDAAHELGHLVLHKHGGPRPTRAAEQDANTFASSFLMPSADVKARIPYILSLDALVDAKKHWRVSALALAYRLHKLGRMSDWQYRHMCIQMSKRGYIDNEPNSIPREESVVWKMVFSDLWNRKVTKADIAKILHLPADEIENLVFGLTSPPVPPATLTKGRPALKAI
ncbi:MAG TPA: XRE family transcriptional regulator [Rhizomicrobium sp.]|nr:XRE family transcriptional regulator [Rhizomicrobium sp.]